MRQHCVRSLFVLVWIFMWSSKEWGSINLSISVSWVMNKTPLNKIIYCSRQRFRVEMFTGLHARYDSNRRALKPLYEYWSKVSVCSKHWSQVCVLEFEGLVCFHSETYDGSSQISCFTCVSRFDLKRRKHGAQQGKTMVYEKELKEFTWSKLMLIHLVNLIREH